MRELTAELVVVRTGLRGPLPDVGLPPAACRDLLGLQRLYFRLRYSPCRLQEVPDLLHLGPEPRLSGIDLRLELLTGFPSGLGAFGEQIVELGPEARQLPLDE